MADAVQIAPVLHAVWTASAALTALVPASRFVTGEVMSESMTRPYVTVNFDQAQVTVTNSGRADRATVFFDVYSDAEATADTIGRTIVEEFCRTNSGRHASGNTTVDCDLPSAPIREWTDLDRWHLQLTLQATAQALFS